MDRRLWPLPQRALDAVFQEPGKDQSGAVAVVGRPDDRKGEAVTVVALLHIEVPVAPRELIACTKSKLAGYTSPKIVDFIDPLPYAPTGKILTRQHRRPK